MAFSRKPNFTLPPGEPVPDYSPEARRRAALSLRGDPSHATSPGGQSGAPEPVQFTDILRRMAVGTWNDGFIHAGNLAYMSILAIFPFFILGAAVVTATGDTADRVATVNAVQAALPPNVGNVIGPAARDAIANIGGWLLWAGSAVALWTVTSLIETIRDILRRAYGTRATTSFLHHRLVSTGILIGAMVMLLLALMAQLLIGTAEEMIGLWAPEFAPKMTMALSALALSRAVPALIVYFSIYMLFLTLTPTAYRARQYPKWPGALAVTLWWLVVTAAFPPLLSTMFSYSLTYGSLAGIMITLFFFWLVGLGVVVGAELNAALARTPEERGAAIHKERIGEDAV